MTTTIDDRNATMTAAWNRGSQARAAPSGFKTIMGHGLKPTPIRATEDLRVFTPSIIARLF
ncbi:hypothetical protein [Roseovarius sp. Pro17]|uniref:hypothetical protein n=1 Tax=Roseovarius sp. Pro17 TaxID=3108175 RepID=UPI002D77D7EE|nr:hypothetical protein [Roseovarius sp. Pro17]